MYWPLPALVRLPLLLHLREDVLPAVTVTPKVINEDDVIVSFGHGLDGATDEPSQSRWLEKVNTGNAAQWRTITPSNRPAADSGAGWPERRGGLCM